jgi:hypothetical protein
MDVVVVGLSVNFYAKNWSLCVHCFGLLDEVTSASKACANVGVSIC